MTPNFSGLVDRSGCLKVAANNQYITVAHQCACMHSPRSIQNFGVSCPRAAGRVIDFDAGQRLLAVIAAYNQYSAIQKFDAGMQ